MRLFSRRGLSLTLEERRSIRRIYQQRVRAKKRGWPLPDLLPLDASVSLATMQKPRQATETGGTHKKPTKGQKKAWSHAYGQRHPDKVRLRKQQQRLNPTVRAREAAATKRWKKAHPAAYAAQWRRRRARVRNAPMNDLTAAQWEEIKQAYGYRCVYCGRKMKRLTQDHLTPLGKGGGHTASNIVPACQSCNGRKHLGPPLVPVQPLLLTVA